MLRVPAREIATDHLLQLANVVREEGLEELATPGQGQLATGVRLTRRLLLIAEADALELGRNEVWLGADVAHRPIVNTARIVVGVVVEQHEQPLAESRLEGLEARRVPAAGDDAESLALGR